MPSPALSALGSLARQPVRPGTAVTRQTTPAAPPGQRDRIATPQTTQIGGRTYRPWTHDPSAQNVTVPTGAIPGQAAGQFWVPLEDSAPAGPSPGAALSYAPQPAAQTPSQQKKFTTSQLLETFGELMPTAPPPVPLPEEVDDRPAMDAAFARAKDLTGKTLASGMRTLQGELDTRGVGGGGYEASRSAEVLGGGVGALGDVAREQAIQTIKRKQAVSDRNLGAGIDQRGQDISLYQNRLPLLLQLLQAKEGVLY
jgi:hypothetical protein